MIRRLAAAALVHLAREKTGMPPFAFHDTKGRAYYAWTDFSELPRKRRLEVDTVMLWIDAGRPRKAIEEIGEAIRAQAEAAAGAKDATTRSKSLAAIGAMTQELLMRSTLVPEECYYALAAATCMREDEQPDILDSRMHQEKITTFREAGAAGHSFFFAIPTLKDLLGAAYTTEGSWKQLLMGWIMEAARRKATLEVCAPK